MENVRTFVCFQLPGFARQELVAVQQRLGRVGVPVGWVKPDNIHLTLRFFGSVPSGRLNEIIRSVRGAARRNSPVDLELTRLGCFPNTRAPRIIWAGPGPVPETLEALHRQVEENLVAAGFAPDTRPFSPHCTLGRVRSRRNVGKLAAAVEAEPFRPLRFSLQEMVVMGSELHPGGALYTPIARLPLET